MFVEQLSGGEVMTTFHEADDAHLYGSAAFPAFSLLGHYVRKFSRDMTDDPASILVTIQFRPNFYAAQRRVAHQADIAERRGSPDAAAELRTMAEHLAEPDAYTTVTGPHPSIISVKHPLQGSVYLCIAPPIDQV